MVIHLSVKRKETSVLSMLAVVLTDPAYTIFSRQSICYSGSEFDDHFGALTSAPLFREFSQTAAYIRMLIFLLRVMYRKKVDLLNSWWLSLHTPKVNFTESMLGIISELRHFLRFKPNFVLPTKSFETKQKINHISFNLFTMAVLFIWGLDLVLLKNV